MMGKGRRKFPKSIPSAAYCEKLPKYVTQLQAQFNYTPIAWPVTLTIDVYEQNESWYRQWLAKEVIATDSGTDVDNKISSVFDILKEAEVLRDDVYIMRVIANKIIGEKLPCCNTWGAKVLIEKWNGLHKRL